MDFQDQQDAVGVRLEGKARASFRMELQGQKNAEVVRMEGEAGVAFGIELKGRQYAASMMDVQDKTVIGVVEDAAATLNWFKTRIK